VLFGVELGTLLELGLLVYALLGVITTPEDQVRNLPKLLWLLVVLVPIVGPVAWLVAGRPQGPARSLPYKGNTGVPPTPPSRTTGAGSPDDDEEFLRSLRRRAEEQRRRAREQEPPA
jgi:hypothetical protein